MRIMKKLYWDLVLQKLVRTLISVKVWVLVATFLLATWIIQIAAANKAWELISAACNLVIAIVGVVVVMREGFKEGALTEKKNDDVK